MAEIYSDHTERVKALALALATIKANLVNKVDNAVFSVAQNEMYNLLGSSNYGSYVAMFGENAYDPDIEFFQLNVGQRKLRMLETAEGYLCLYYLALRTKEMVDKQAFVRTVSIGDGSITPVEINRFIDMRHQYYNHAKKLIRQYTDMGPVEFITPNNPDINEYGINVSGMITSDGRSTF